MTDSTVGVPLDIDRATDWVRGSLAQGTTLAGLTTATLARYRSALLLAPESRIWSDSIHLDDSGRGVAVVEADAVAARFLAQLREVGGRTLIVENDLARRGDALRRDESCFVEDRVLAWVELTADVSVAASLLRRGSSGYPLNAFVSRLPALDLGLARGHQLSAEEIDVIVDSILAIVVSVFDAEAYVAVATVESPG